MPRTRGATWASAKARTLSRKSRSSSVSVERGEGVAAAASTGSGMGVRGIMAEACSRRPSPGELPCPAVRCARVSLTAATHRRVGGADPGAVGRPVGPAVPGASRRRAAGPARGRRRGPGPAPAAQPQTPPAPSAAGAQPAAQPAAQPPAFRTGINFVRVDALVTDNKGNAVENLTQDDFEVYEDNKPQKVESFRYIKVEGNPHRGRAAAGRSARPGTRRPSSRATTCGCS